MADRFDDQRFRNEVEALALAICGIHRHAAPDRPVLDMIVQREVDRATPGATPDARTLDPETIRRLVKALADWRERAAEADAPEAFG